MVCQFPNSVMKKKKTISNKTSFKKPNENYFFEGNDPSPGKYAMPSLKANYLFLNNNSHCYSFDLSLHSFSVT